MPWPLTFSTHTHTQATYFSTLCFLCTQARNFSALRRWLVPYHWSVTSYTGYALQLWLTPAVRILWTYIPTACQNWYAGLTSSEQWRYLRRALGMVYFTNTCYSFDARSRLGRHVESHRPNLFGSWALYTHPFYQTSRRKYVTAHPTYTYISLTPTKYSYKLINSHLLLTMHILDNAQAPYLLADVTALLQLRTMHMTSSPVLVQLIPPTLKARSAHVRPPPLFYSVY